ncbi:unnamed protein product [Rhizoctonia solani]|uniref:Uncharacterized protein n=1 Tax=Rhizoctonia solani TaxID=456999 RepID=A0A8H3GEF9_9AGAM|nr:unnamed protein product [Rhizoctonia solani]
MPGPDDFQLRLVQWLLEQLNSRKELETVTQQISLLISQAQEQSLGDLYAHIGTLIFQRAIGKGPETCIQPCAEFCHSLSVAHLKQRLSLSPRVTLVHDHIFRLCLDSICARNTLEPANATPRSKHNEILVERSSKLLFNLWDFQLVSIVQICEYIFRVIEAHKTSVGPEMIDAVAAVRFLLRSCFPNCSYGHWENEVNVFHEWVDSCSSPNETEINAVGLGDLGRINEANAASQAEHTVTKHKNHSPRPNAGDSSPNSTNDVVLSKETSHLSQDQVNQAEIMENTTRNNFGQPPQSPLTLHMMYTAAGTEHWLETPVIFWDETDLEDMMLNPDEQPANDIQTATPALKASTSVSMGSSVASTSLAKVATPPGTPLLSRKKKANVHALLNQLNARPTLPSSRTSGGQKPTESSRISANVPLQHQHPIRAPPHWESPVNDMIQIHPPQMKPSPRIQPAQTRPTSTPPASNNTSPHPLSVGTSPQAPQSARSPPLNVNAPMFVPGGIRRRTNPIRMGTPDNDSEDRIPASPEVTTPIIELQNFAVMETERLAKEQKAKEKGTVERRKWSKPAISIDDDGFTTIPNRRSTRWEGPRRMRGSDK